MILEGWAAARVAAAAWAAERSSAFARGRKTSPASVRMRVPATKQASVIAVPSLLGAFWNSPIVKLPGSSYKDALPFLMYPQAEDKSGLVDPLDADAFKYKITARELKG